MLVPLAAIWVPTAVGIAFAGGLLGILVVWVKSDPGPDADDSDSDSGGGGAGWWRRRPRRPPPGGPVAWHDFERQFAAYVERRGEPVAPERVSSEAVDRRGPDAAGDVRHATVSVFSEL
jgi:hypothetical protein